MEKILVLIFFIFSSSQLKVDIEPTSVSEMVEKSDLIFHGKITKVIKDDIEVSIIENLKGKPLKKKIKIRKFQNWLCAFRYQSYAVGQEEIFFIQKNKKENIWIIMGGGDEGEIPVVKNVLYFKSAFYYCSQPNDNGILKLKNGENIYGFPYDLKEAKKGISLYLQKEQEIKAKFQDGSILDFYPKNKFLLAIINEMICDHSRGITEEQIAKRKFDE